MGKTICPKCDNTQGFAFGTCIECGWNHLDHSFQFIKVYVSDLNRLCEHADYFIDGHERRVKPRFEWQKAKR